MIDETKTFIKAALQTAGFSKGKITTTTEDSFNANFDIRPVSAFYAVKVEDIENISHSGTLKYIPLRLLIILADYDHQNATLKLIDLDDALNGKTIDFSDARFSMEEGWRMVPDSLDTLVNAKDECSYVIEYEAKITVRKDA